MKKYTEQELKGMTTNERLFVSGLLHKFDSAQRSKNRNKMIQLLTQCAFTKEESESITDTILGNPEKYRC